MEKEPVIVMTITLSGASVTVDNTEVLRSDQLTGFHILANKVRHFATGLVDKAIEMQNARPETVN